MSDSQRMSAAQAIVAALQAEGVEQVFGYPGGQVLEIYDALYDSPIRHILVRHEQAAVHAADGYARSSGKPGVVVVTSGPGATNTVTGIATAFMDSIPLVLICGQVNCDAIGSDAFQEADITGITMPITKHSYLVKDPRELPRVIKEAFYIASSGRPGPVLIDVPGDVQAAQIDFSYPEQVKLSSYKPGFKVNRRQAAAAANLLSKAKRPVLYVGGGIIASGAEEQLLQLARRLQIPVAVTLMGKGCFPASDPLYLGMPGMHGAMHVNKALEQADVLLAVGVRFADRVAGKLADLARSTKVIHVDIDPAEIGKNQETDVPIVGDAAQALQAIMDELDKCECSAEHADWFAQIDVWRKSYGRQGAFGDKDIVPQSFFSQLSAALESCGKDWIVSTEVGQHQMWAAQYLPLSKPRHFLSSGGLGTMGFGFPAAIGAQIASPQSLVICIAGDGSLQMNIQEMATARAYGLPVKIILMNNGALGMVRQQQALLYQGRFSASQFDFQPDFCAIAAAYGWQSQSIGQASDVPAALQWLISSQGPALLELKISPEELVLPMVPPGSTVDDAIWEVRP